MFVYVLTSLTGRKRNAGRTVIVNGFEFNRRALIVTLRTGIPGLGLGLILSIWFGPLMTVLVPGVALAVAFGLFEQRSRKGLQIQMYQALQDKRKADTSQFYMCWQPVDAELGFATIAKSSVPVTPTPDTTAASKDPLTFTSPRGRAAHRGSSTSALLQEA